MYNEQTSLYIERKTLYIEHAACISDINRLYIGQRKLVYRAGKASLTKWLVAEFPYAYAFNPRPANYLLTVF